MNTATVENPKGVAQIFSKILGGVQSAKIYWLGVGDSFNPFAGNLWPTGCVFEVPALDKFDTKGILMKWI
jgi:hypothetical protein